FTRALALKPDWTMAQFHRSLALEKQLKFAAAEAELTALLKRPDAPARAWLQRANVRRKAGNHAGAAEDLAEGMKATATDALSLNARGLGRMKSDPVAALADFEQAIRADPRLWEPRQNKAGVLADYLSRPRDAVAALDQLLEIYPEYVEARAGRGVYLARLGEKDRAARDADDCLLEDRSPFRLYQMAGLFAQLWKHDHNPGTREQAVQLLSRALRAGIADFKPIDKDDPDIAPLRNDPEFQRLVEHARGLQVGR